jgi:2-polyprenyl-3-methyl-5-hydroxy-6-metoxy-1,4-benzoquinol methylase
VKPATEVREDFDRIARVVEAAGLDDAPQRYEDEVVRRVPAGCGRVLEVGCGTGRLSRALARRADHVLALDLSPEMIRIARERSPAAANVEYAVSDVAAWEPPGEAFDAVVCVATLHHLPAADTLRRLAAALRPGGVLVVQDVIARPGPMGFAKNLLAGAVRALRGGWRSGIRSAALRRAYREHGRGETYPTMPEVRALYAATLPGTEVAEHLEWRYTAVWRRPA